MEVNAIYNQPVNIKGLMDAVTQNGSKISAEEADKVPNTPTKVIESMSKTLGTPGTLSMGEVVSWNRIQITRAKDDLGIGWGFLNSKGTETEQLGSLEMLAANGTKEAINLLEEYFRDEEGFNITINYDNALKLAGVGARVKSPTIRKAIADKIVPFLLANHFENVISDRRYGAINAVGELGEQALPYLTGYLEKVDFPVDQKNQNSWKVNNKVRSTILAISRLGRDGEAAVGLLLGIAKNEKAGNDFRAGAASALGSVAGGRSKEVLVNLFALANEDSGSLSANAYTAAMEIVTDNLELAIPYLIHEKSSYRGAVHLILINTYYSRPEDDNRIKVIDDASAKTTDPVIQKELAELRAEMERRLK